MTGAPESLLEGRVTLYVGDSRDVLAGLPDASIDSCVCDPPYALVSIAKRFGKAGAVAAKDYSGERPGATGAYARASAGFMGQGWDTGETAFDPAFWREVLRVLKPGGHVVAFGGTRSYHHLAMAIETAGFEMRDSIANLFDISPEVRRFVESLDAAQLDAFLRIADLIGFEGLLLWVYGTGFPKSHDVSKGIDKAAGHWRGRAGAVKAGTGGQVAKGTEYERSDKREPVTAAAAAWEGWGTALKPAWEPICLARKPLDGTVAETVLRWGTGALNIDGSRIETGESWGQTGDPAGNGILVSALGGGLNNSGRSGSNALGRWPANLVHDGSDEVVAGFPASGDKTASAPRSIRKVLSGSDTGGNASTAFGAESRSSGAVVGIDRGDNGSAARFFYSAKADADDRIGSGHPTVKRVDLMRWLVRLVTPPNGMVLDPFAGTGTTGEAAVREGMRAILIEREPRFAADIRRRMALVTEGQAVRRAARAKAKAERQAAPADHGPLFTNLDKEAAE